MLPIYSKNKELNSIVDQFYKRYQKEILDIILFGSAIRGKDEPNDIDILILFKNKEDLDMAYELRKRLEKISLNIQITTKTYNNLFNKNFKAREAFLSEGYSFIRKEFVARSLAYSNIVFFKYELNGFSQSKRMQLQYALYGRDKRSGIVQELGLNKFADTLFICPVEKSEQLKELFDNWRIKYLMFPVLVPGRILL